MATFHGHTWHVFECGCEAHTPDGRLNQWGGIITSHPWIISTITNWCLSVDAQAAGIEEESESDISRGAWSGPWWAHQRMVPTTHQETLPARIWYQLPATIWYQLWYKYGTLSLPLSLSLTQGLFVYHEDSGLYWFSSSVSGEECSAYHLVGLVSTL